MSANNRSETVDSDVTARLKAKPTVIISAPKTDTVKATEQVEKTEKYIRI